SQHDQTQHPPSVHQSTVSPQPERLPCYDSTHDPTPTQPPSPSSRPHPPSRSQSKRPTTSPPGSRPLQPHYQPPNPTHSPPASTPPGSAAYAMQSRRQVGQMQPLQNSTCLE